MITITKLAPRAYCIAAVGEFRQADVETLATFIREQNAEAEGGSGSGSGNLLIDVTSLADISLAAVLKELGHMRMFLKYIYSLKRIAIVSDEEWIRTAARLESALLPGLTYQVYDDDEADAARAWIMEESDEPHKGALRELDIGRTDIAAFEVVGRLDDTETTRGIAMVEERLKGPRCGKLMMVIRHWHGFEAELLFSRSLFASKLRLIDKIERYAIVGGPSWVGGVAQTMGMLVKPEIKAFDLDEEDEAVEWLSEALVEMV